jgi:hypothetical protein
MQHQEIGMMVMVMIMVMVMMMAMVVVVEVVGSGNMVVMAMMARQRQRRDASHHLMRPVGGQNPPVTPASARGSGRIRTSCYDGCCARVGSKVVQGSRGADRREKRSYSVPLNECCNNCHHHEYHCNFCCNCYTFHYHYHYYSLFGGGVGDRVDLSRA